MTINKVSTTDIVALDRDTEREPGRVLDLEHGSSATTYTESTMTMTIMDATPPATVSAFSDKGDYDDYDHDDILPSFPPPQPAFLCPWPGSTYVIRAASSGAAILTLHGGEVTLSPPNRHTAVGSSVHWACEEHKGWLGFRNVASGKYLGYDGHHGKGKGKGSNRHGRLVCVAPRQQGWENFVIRPRPDGAYLLLTTHYDRLWRVGTRVVEQQQAKGKGKDNGKENGSGKTGDGDSGKEEILAKIDDDEAPGEEIVWEFIKV